MPLYRYAIAGTLAEDTLDFSAAMPRARLENLIAEALHASPHFLWNRDAGRYDVIDDGESLAETRLAAPPPVPSDAPERARVPHVIAFVDATPRGGTTWFKRLSRSRRYPIDYDLVPTAARRFPSKRAAMSALAAIAARDPAFGGCAVIARAS